MAVSKHQTGHTRAWLELIGGLLLVITGVVITVTTFEAAEEASGGHYVLAFGPVVAGAALAMHGISDLAGYRSFVAWRYLLVAVPKVTRRTKVLIVATLVARVAWWVASGHGQEHTYRAFAQLFTGAISPTELVTVGLTTALVAIVVGGVLRHSRPALIAFVIGAVLGVVSIVGGRMVSGDMLPYIKDASAETRLTVIKSLDLSMVIGFGIAGLAVFFGCLRAFFTFFTTVPIGGVWIGTSALVMVLAVMGGFETDLRDKILGSNAHIQITREDGEFVEWREIKERIDKIPGVVASTPYAVSEVVIAAHNNGMNVIIKGIDPATVGLVTDLVSDLEDPEAMARLAPLIDDSQDLTVPQTPPDGPAEGGEVLDPPPDDMPQGGEPIDFSTSTPALRDLSPPPAAPRGGGPALEPMPALDDVFDAPGEAADAADPAEVLDPPPDDLLSTDVPPVDYSSPAADLDDSGDDGDDGDDDDVIEAFDMPAPTLSRRTQALPGVLVGRELVKQTHLYTGEEVRIVSPLSDPSNPDATGTPIPFNRDYRVAGIFFTGMYEYDLKYVYVTLDSLQDFLDRGDAIDGIEVRITDPDNTERYVPSEAGPGLIRQALGPGYRVVDWRELNRSLFSALKLEKIAMFLVLGIVILVASFSIVGNLIMVVVEKEREIALLKTLGASDAGVMQLFAIQGLMIGLIGTVLGVTTGLLGCSVAKRFGLPLNPDVYYIDKLPIHVDPQSVAAAAAAGIIISLAATLYPALVAARVRPAAGMRH